MVRANVVYYFSFLSEQKPVVTSSDVVYFPEFDVETLVGQANLVSQASNVISYVLIWIGTVKLLYPYIKKFGKVKFWAFMVAPMIYYLINFPLFVLGYFNPENVDAMTNIIIFNFAAIFTGVIFGVAFLSVAKTLNKDSDLRNHMIIASLWIYSLFHCWFLYGFTASISPIWISIYILCRTIVLPDLFRALFFSGYSISRHRPTQLYKKVRN